MSESNEIRINQRVELKPGMEAVYKKAGPASQAIVVDQKVDEDGFELVKVEWDKEHWRYNGEPDQWTYKHHFQPVEKTTLYEARTDTRKFAKDIIERVREEGLSEEKIERYIDQLNEVANLLAESEGFILLAAREEPSPTDPEESITVSYTFGSFLSPQAMLLLESQLMTMAASNYQDSVCRVLDQLKRYRDDEDYPS